MGTNSIDLSRRGFLTGRQRPPKIRPPWTRQSVVAASCTGCSACVTACPQGIIALDGDERPALRFDAAECTFCGACAQACPEPVFDLSLPAFPHVVAIGEACFARRGIVCQSCGDTCPASAIRFRPRIGGPALPELSAERCTGCGACISSCPAAAISVGGRNMEAAHA